MCIRDSFSTSARHLGYEIRSDAPLRPDSHTAIWGPYKALKAGHFRFECLIEAVAEEFDVGFDIATNSGQDILAAGSIHVGQRGYPEFALEVDRSYDTFEFRLLVRQGSELPLFRFFGLRLVHAGVMRGQHQSEAMALLAHLTGMRLRDAYMVETL